MTSVDLSPHDVADTRSLTGTRRKGTLFCPECGHESPVGGDWETAPDGRARCPECLTRLAR